LNAIIRYIINIGYYERLIVLAELLLIGVFVYIVVSFLEGTRGERLFRGIIFVLLVGSLILNLVVRQFEMERIAYLYSGFLIAVLIIAVTAFQPVFRCLRSCVSEILRINCPFSAREMTPLSSLTTMTRASEAVEMPIAARCREPSRP
jgi:DNA integrity scanning protein DisA with diadenylate cyclase activity